MRSPRAFLKDIAGPCETEGARLLLMAGYLLLIITCYTTTKAVRDSLFIIEIGPSQLPILYMLIALGMAVISAIYPRVLRRFGLYALVGMTSLVSVATLVLFWWVVDNESRTSLYVLYIWVSLFGAITASQAWSLASHVFDAREARRSFAWIGLGGVVGGIVGGSLARVVAPWLGTETLLPICAALMGVTVLILRRLALREDREVGKEARSSAGESADSGLAVLGQIRKSRYVSMMVALLLSGVLVEAFVDYEFKVVAHQAFDSKDRLTSFFGTIASYGGVLALLIQTLLTNRLLKRFGVGAAILLLPSALLTGFFLVSVWPALWAVSILKLIDGCLSYSVHRSGMELLFVPIPAKLRAAVKALIDMLVDRAGRAVGGVLLLVLTAGLSLSVPTLSVVVAGVLILWIGVAFAIRRNYVQAFRVALEKKVIEPEALGVQTLDSTISRPLLEALSSSDDRQVLYALGLLGSGHAARWSRHQPELIDHKTPAVRSRTIALLTEWRSFATSLVETRLLDSDLDVRIEVVRHLCEASRDGARSKLSEFLKHPDYRVVLAAILCIAKYRPSDGDLIDEQFIERALATTGEHSASAKAAAARSLAITRLPRATEFLDRLLRDPSVPVVQQAIHAAGEIRYEGAISVLILMLGRSRFRRAAREALLKIGGPATEELKLQFQDDRTPMDVRVRIPKVISMFRAQEAADFLLHSVHRSTPRLDTMLLKALNNMRNQPGELAFEPERVSALIATECERHQRLSMIRAAIRAVDTENAEKGYGEIMALLEKAIGERMAESVERVFRLLYLVYSTNDIRAVYLSFNSKSALRASAVEFLDNLIDPPLRSLVVPVVEDRERSDPNGRSKESELSQADAIRMLMAEDDEWLRTIAGELDEKWHVLSSGIA